MGNEHWEGGREVRDAVVIRPAPYRARGSPEALGTAGTRHSYRLELKATSERSASRSTTGQTYTATVG